MPPTNASSARSMMHSSSLHGHCSRQAQRGAMGAVGSRVRVLSQRLGSSTRHQRPAQVNAFSSDDGGVVPRLPPNQAGPVLVWFKHDLRLSDHPGLLAAVASGAPIIPCFSLCPSLYSPLALTPGGPAALLAGLVRLRGELRAAGSDLVVRAGPAWDVVSDLVAATGATRIVMEREEESRWLEASHRLAQCLEASGSPARITTWQAPLWPKAGFTTNFKKWQKQRGKPLKPLTPPAGLQPLPDGVDPGSLPSLDELRELLADSLAAGPSGRAALHSLAQQDSSVAAGEGDVWASRAPARAQLLQRVAAEPEAVPYAAYVNRIMSLLQGNESSADGLQYLGSSGPLDPAAVLEGYLQASEGARPTDPRLAFLTEAVSQLEGPAAVGASFPALLGPLLQLGLLSSRQVYDVTNRVEVARWGGRMPLLGPSSTTAKAALSAVELSDFHRALASHIPQEGDSGSIPPSSSSSSVDEPVASAASSYEEGPDGVQQWGVMDWPQGTPRRCSWRWRGALTDYCVVEPKNPKPGAPALVLVHGFGAFGDQWRFNLGPLAEAGYTVYAPTLPGFGRSEKAALQYSQNAWRDFVRDFLVGVVGRPAVLAGNSIGGFISASAAADYPELVAGLALVNTAGPITPGISEAEVVALTSEMRTPPSPWFVRLTTFGLMAYLQNSIGKQLKWLYPTNPQAADKWLEQEIYRAACDARSADVFASVFYLPKPRPLNYLINDLWRGPTAVVQGVLDPLNDARGRADQLERECPGTRVWAINAGHCPHDEAPAEVNSALLEFVEQMVMPAQQQQQQEAAVGKVPVPSRS